MKLLYPAFRRGEFLAILGFTTLGGLIGGSYGIVHDLVTFSICREYFVRLKFNQFSWANIGLPEQLFAAEIGAIATGAVGAIAGWFLGRTAVPACSPALAKHVILQGFVLIIAAASIAGALGNYSGVLHDHNYGNWDDVCDALGVVDVPDFVRVAYIHNGSYIIGGLLGLLLAISIVRLATRAEARSCFRQ